MPFLLDTDICIYALRQHPSVLPRLLATPRSEVAISTITEAELRTGAAKSQSPAKTLRLLERFLHPLERIEFTSEDAVHYAAVRAKLERTGTPIGPLDTLIGAQALSRKMVVVTNNEREFRRVPGLRVENWATEA